MFENFFRANEEEKKKEAEKFRKRLEKYAITKDTAIPRADTAPAASANEERQEKNILTQEERETLRKKLVELRKHRDEITCWGRTTAEDRRLLEELDENIAEIEQKLSS